MVKVARSAHLVQQILTSMVVYDQSGAPEALDRARTFLGFKIPENFLRGVLVPFWTHSRKNLKEWGKPYSKALPRFP